jgi:hypothetical protein
MTPLSIMKMTILPDWEDGKTRLLIVKGKRFASIEVTDFNAALAQFKLALNELNGK